MSLMEPTEIDGVDATDVAVRSAVVSVITAVTRGPGVDGALATTTLNNNNNNIYYLKTISCHIDINKHCTIKMYQLLRNTD